MNNQEIASRLQISSRQLTVYCCRSGNILLWSLREILKRDCNWILEKDKLFILDLMNSLVEFSVRGNSQLSKLLVSGFLTVNNASIKSLLDSYMLKSPQYRNGKV